jgi:dipeptidyl aminopeptidase/acylaminoacyl peptidase
MKLISIVLLSLISYLTFSQNILTPELLWKLKRVSGGQLSPDGKLILFNVKTYDMAANSGNSDLYTYDIKKNKVSQLTQTPFSEMEAQWGKNNTIWFMSNQEDGLQIWRMSSDGEFNVRVSNFTDVQLGGFKLAKDESSVVTIEAVKTKTTVQDKYPDLPLAEAHIQDDLMYRHWNHWVDENSSHLFLHKLVDGKIEDTGKDLLKGEIFNGILPPFGGSEQFTFSGDGKSVVYTSKKKVGKEFALSTNTQLYQYVIDQGKTKNLTEKYAGYDMAPQYDAEGKFMAWLSMSRDGVESDKNDIIIRHMDTGKDINLTKTMDLSVNDFAWHPSGKFIYFIAATKGTKQIFEVNLGSGKERQVTSGNYDYVSLSVSSDFIISGRQSMTAPTELYSVSLKTDDVKQLTHFNDDAMNSLELPTVEERWVETTDGKKMLVWMILPPNFDATKKYPTLLYCQGGPQSPVSQFFSYRWNFTLMASQGYIVVAPNRRGLPGFGQEWNEEISKDWGGQAMRDYLTAIDNATNEPYVDEERLGAVGASYGGYSVYYLAGIHQNRFKTFISHCGLFNLESWYGTTEELFFANHDIGGPYWLDSNKKLYEKNSPHKLVKNWNTPLLVIHGGMDYRVPQSEGMQAFQAAQLMGLRSKFLYFPKEGHWVQSPQNALLWHREFFEWLDHDLKQ